MFGRVLGYAQAPAASPDGKTLYVGCDDDNLYAVSTS